MNRLRYLPSVLSSAFGIGISIYGCFITAEVWWMFMLNTLFAWANGFYFGRSLGLLVRDLSNKENEQ